MQSNNTWSNADALSVIIPILQLIQKDNMLKLRNTNAHWKRLSQQKQVWLHKPIRYRFPIPPMTCVSTVGFRYTTNLIIAILDVEDDYHFHNIKLQEFTNVITLGIVTWP